MRMWVTCSDTEKEREGEREGGSFFSFSPHMLWLTQMFSATASSALCARNWWKYRRSSLGCCTTEQMHSEGDNRGGERETETAREREEEIKEQKNKE